MKTFFSEEKDNKLAYESNECLDRSSFSLGALDDLEEELQMKTREAAATIARLRAENKRLKTMHVSHDS